MKIKALLFMLAICLSTNAQSQPAKIIIDQDDNVNPWNHLEVNNGETQFQIAIVTDRTGGHRPGIFLDGINKLNLLQPEFVMSVGDLIEGYTEDLNELNRQWDEFDGFIEKLEVPFFYVVGNHDYTNPVMANLWEERLGRTYYHFRYKDVLFLCLNSEEDRANEGGRFTKILDEQYKYAEKVLKENEDARWTLVFMHKPMWVYNNTGRWPDIEKLLSTRKHTVFAGHQHHYVKYEQNNGKYFMLATTGGGSGLRGPALGEFDHVVWLTMTEKGPVIANLMLEGIWSEDVVNEKQWELVSKVRRANPLRVEPIIVDDEIFTTGESKLRLTNDSDVPMTAHISFENYLDLRPGMTEMEKEVAPNSVEIVDLPLSTAKRMKLDEIDPIKLNAKFIFKAEGQPEVEIPSQSAMKPVMPMPLRMTSIKHEVDGNLKEWGQLSQKVSEEFIDADPFSHKGEKDGSVQFDLTYDSENFYIAAKISDDELLNDPNRSTWQQDAFVLQVHGGPLSQSVNASSIYDGVGIWQVPTKADEEIRRWCRSCDDLKVQSVVLPVDGGFVAEASIPLAVMDSLQGGSWDYIRLNIGMVDFDMDYQHESTILWRPSWDSKANYVGSGLFRREESTEMNAKKGKGKGK